MALVHVPPIWRSFTHGARAVEVRGSSVRQLLLSMALAHPGIGGYLFAEDGDQPPHLNVYLHEREVRELAGFDTPAEVSDELVLLPAMAGGTPPTPAPLPPAVRLDLNPAALRELEVRAQAVADELIRVLAQQPRLLYQLQPRQLEELMAELYEREGFEVELTPATRDGGVDLFLVQHTSFGKMLTLVDTKRNAPHRPVGVGVVRRMFGVVEAKRANAGVVATTSFFTKPARTFQEEVSFRLGLQEFRDVHRMLQQAASRRLNRPPPHGG